LIVQSPEIFNAELCSTPGHVDCPSARRAGEPTPYAPRCPFLQASHMQYCSAASITKFIPYSESLLSRCGTENHRYCEAYLGLARPVEAADPSQAAPEEDHESGDSGSADGVPVSFKTAYSPNHMWLDIGEDGSCHVGVDALFARVLGRADRLNFVTTRGFARPSVVISVCGIDLQMIFPNPMLVTRTNDYLRASPDKLISHPHSLGWLFEGEAGGVRTSARNDLCAGLIHGKAALEWMRAEMERMSRFVHDRCSLIGALGECLAMDGGTVRSGLVQHLNREEVFILFNEFFAYYTNWRK
jgi:hypothetical protein